MTSRYKVISVNDDKDFCECCGRQGLMRVVWIEDTETQEIKHFGTTCAASPVIGFGADTEITSAIREFQDHARAVLTYAHRLYRKAGGTYTGNGKDGWKADDMNAVENCIAQAKVAHK